MSVCLRNGEGGYSGVSDTYMSAWAPPTNFADGPEGADLQVRSQGIKRALIRFDLSHITADAVVTMARLDLRTGYYRSGNDPMELSFYRFRVPWVESQVTWQGPATGEAWNAPGAAGEADRDMDPVATVVLDATNAWFDVELVEIVQEWISNPIENLGLLLEGEGVSLEYRLWSSDFINIVHRPRLCLEYVLPTPTPTPTMTSTHTPTATSTPTPTPTPTEMVAPTETPALTPTRWWIFLPIMLRCASVSATVSQGLRLSLAKVS